MAARKRASSVTNSAKTALSEPASSPTELKTAVSGEDFRLAPPKLGVIFVISSLLCSLYLYLLCFHYNVDNELKRPILINAGLSLVGFFVTLKLIPVAARYVLRRNMFGFDINKRGTPQGEVKVPESLGIVVGIVFLIVAIVFQFFNFTEDSVWLVEYNAALASICFMILLGFVDDVLDVPWRVKLLLPSFATLPLLMAYAGHTTIVIPKPLVSYIGLEVFDLGRIYKLYMALLAVFCTNSINIHAGLNGLEIGQTVVIAAAILIHNVMQIGASVDTEYHQAHAFSIYLTQPLMATSLAMLAYNWYPSAVFVGDTYTVFAGMTMAVVGILGHFSETLLIFFLPQVLNFLLSLPQLAGIVKCPRHRLPKFDPATGQLTGTKDGTLVNVYLRIFGRKSEKSLCIHLLVFQALACAFCFMLRHFLAGWYK
ncbi:Glycosyl transferase family 4 [Arabidopsis suecica]|uniref:Glycosyl transferase family 4 n=1 Tax=Arabidopsis suecica TaxID=45249 RepID=A0A8T2A142_ARASU|nr:Glycosyl transferase family 4 [Arabidopsis suecica]